MYYRVYIIFYKKNLKIFIFYFFYQFVPFSPFFRNKKNKKFYNDYF